MYLAGLESAETIYCTVGLETSMLDFSLWMSLEGKIKRTRPFYVNDFKYMKTLVAKEVSVGWPLDDRG